MEQHHLNYLVAVITAVTCLIGNVLHGQVPTGTVRVAAIQCASIMGDTERNMQNLIRSIEVAASQDAKIIVLPECAVQGYTQPTTWTSWSREPTDEYYVGAVAEAIPGPSTRRFGKLAERLGVYICAGLIEADSNTFYNAQVLVGPDGALKAHHRKRSLWTPGDSTWCTRGDLPVQVVDSPYGRLGLMICYDFHTLPPLLAKNKADIVLYSVGWYGPNEKQWFRSRFPAKAVIPYGFHVILANWSGLTPSHTWPGRGHSCIIDETGEILSMATTTTGNEIIITDLKLPPTTSQVTDRR
jgi:predicted amidohydrolase